MGLPYPGHEVRVVDGEVCARVDGDPVAFLGYWRNEEATAAKVRDGWLHTGDQAEQDEDGYVYFVGRDDDVISSAGHRIGPGPIEECLIRHPAVSLAAVIGSPDAERGEVVKAYVVAAPGVDRVGRPLARAPGIRAGAALARTSTRAPSRSSTSYRRPSPGRSAAASCGGSRAARRRSITADDAAGPRAGRGAVLPHPFARDPDADDAVGRAARVVVRRRVDEALGVEQDEVGAQAGRDPAAVRRGRAGRPSGR